ncbi:MAG: hypothetical protein EHM56_10170 [Chloroflexi bacterium]|nr:MAG: hypothetical protein EHM56_10170 [Chloroflexota bacterium]
MCFSAEASFAASGVLAAGSVAIARIPKQKAAIPLSLFPAVFSAHQLIEGLIWLNQDGTLPDAYRPGIVHAYALIAYVFWPIFVPFAACLVEGEKRRRAILLVCQAIGLWCGASLLLSLARDPVVVSADCCSLSYFVNAPAFLTAPYLVATCLPFLLCSQRNLVLFGVGLVATCAAAALSASASTFPSVWCFFAALFSGGLYLHFRGCAQTIAHQPGQRARCEAVRT